MIGWEDEELDGETTAEMLEVLEERRRLEAKTTERDKRLWEDYKDFFGRDGSLAIRPPRL